MLLCLAEAEPLALEAPFVSLAGVWAAAAAFSEAMVTFRSVFVDFSWRAVHG